MVCKGCVQLLVNRTPPKAMLCIASVIDELNIKNIRPYSGWTRGSILGSYHLMKDPGRLELLDILTVAHMSRVKIDDRQSAYHHSARSSH